jgi:MFS family permease
MFQVGPFNFLSFFFAGWSFIVGAFILAAFSLGCGFVGDKITLFILRALAGVGAAMTVPSALSLIIEWFPEADEQARGIAFFGGSGALGNGKSMFAVAFRCLIL